MKKFVGMLPLPVLLTPLPLLLLLLPLLLLLLPLHLFSYFLLFFFLSQSSPSVSFSLSFSPTLLLFLLFILPPSVPSTIPVDTIQVEARNIITWEPPTEPNGVIRYYNIRISHHNGIVGEGSVQVVQGVTGTRYDFSVLGLNAGTYMIQVGSLFFILYDV